MTLTEPEARARLAAARVARLATADEGGRPHVVPVTFDVRGDSIVIAVDHKPKRTPDLKRLRNIRANPRVSVLADHYEEDWTRLWWVRADGVAALLEDAAGRAEPVARLCGKYPQYRERPPEGPVIAIAIDAVSGWSYA
ncbi:MAG TPA: TIGR03668 family PPOX class F420-dependent oxidoreductase [Candidatus Dormibacteraeota bacterium]|nr:TIGR03668 family PPOX class F420-dependent oxidoreductase [Candidatus Dormibacteraeota bacterium]